MARKLEMGRKGMRDIYFLLWVQCLIDIVTIGSFHIYLCARREMEKYIHGPIVQLQTPPPQSPRPVGQILTVEKPLQICHARP